MKKLLAALVAGASAQLSAQPAAALDEITVGYLYSGSCISFSHFGFMPNLFT